MGSDVECARLQFKANSIKLAGRNLLDLSQRVVVDVARRVFHRLEWWNLDNDQIYEPVISFIVVLHFTFVPVSIARTGKS